MEAYPLIGDNLVWLIGNGQKVQIGSDPWIWRLEAPNVLNRLLECIHDQKPSSPNRHI